MFIKILVRINNFLILAIILLWKNIMMIQTQLVVDKMNDEKSGVAVKKFAGLKPKMYSFLVDDNSEHKTSKGVNKIAVEK